jgi:hypothetical protein
MKGPIGKSEILKAEIRKATNDMDGLTLKLNLFEIPRLAISRILKVAIRCRLIAAGG